MATRVRPGPYHTATRPRKASHVAERLVDGELVLYDVRRQRVHALNPTAAFVWLSCDGDHAQADIAAALIERYPDHRGAIEEDVAATLDLFQVEGLLEARAPSNLGIG